MKLIRFAKGLLTVVLALSAMVMWTSLPANANHAGGASTGILRPSTWQVCVSGYIAGQNATSFAINQVNRSRVNAYTTHCPSGYNVSSRSANYPDTWYGATYCVEWGSGNACKAKAVRLNGRTISSRAQWRKTATHEFGHVGGLGHRYTNGSAMTQGAAPPISRTFDRHDIRALNNTY